MRFIPIKSFCEQIGFSKDLSNSDNKAEFIDFLVRKKTDGLLWNGELMDDKEWDVIVETVQSGSHLIFHSWIQQNKPLLNFLTTGKPTSSFSDQQHHLSHILANEYKNFITPFLTPLILKFEDSQDLKLVSNAFSYVAILNGDYRSLVESKISKVISTKLSELLQKGAATKTEQDLIEIVTPLCSDEVIEIIDQLSRASYASKIEYINSILGIIYIDACTVRLANWLLKQVQKIKLNEDHLQDIKKIQKDLAQGKIAVRNRAKSSGIGITGRQLLIWAFILILATTSIYIIVDEPFNSKEQEEIAQETSFGQFTKDERQKIDSLLRKIQNKEKIEDTSIDPNAPLYGQSMELVTRTPFYNDEMEQYYQDLKLDCELQESGLIDSCSAVNNMNAHRYEGVKDLLRRKGSQEVMIKNDSEYDVVVIAFENHGKGKMYSTYVKKNETCAFELNLYDYLLCIPGNDYGKFFPPQAKQPKIPSDHFTHHFCDVDANYRNGITTTYQLIHAKSDQAKFLITGVKNSYFQLLDVNGVLKNL